MRGFLRAAVLVLAVAVAGIAGAQTGEARPIRLIVPTATGGTADVLARQIAARLQATTRQALVVENRTGAGGNLGAEAVAKSPADGSVLGLLSNAMIVAQAVGTKPRFDVQKEFTPIALLGQTPMALVAHPQADIKSLAQLVARAKARPGTLAYASCGLGTPHHLVVELLAQMTDVQLSHVAYRGCSPALTDVLGGQVPLAIISANLAIPHVRSGKLVAVGVSSAQRYAGLPDVPTFEQQGARPLAITNWFALMGPAKMDAALVRRLEADMKAILDDPAIRSTLADAGVDVQYGDAAQLTRLVAADRARYEQVARKSDIKLE